jgi:hypothetical protein
MNARRLTINRRVAVVRQWVKIAITHTKTQSRAFPFKARKMSNSDWILMIKKRKLKLKWALQDAKNRIEFGRILLELFVIKRVHKLLGHPVLYWEYVDDLIAAPRPCSDGQFTCRLTGVCLPMGFRCDREIDCGRTIEGRIDDSDEEASTCQ